MQEPVLTKGLEKALKKLESPDPSTRADGAKTLVQELEALGATKDRIAAAFGTSSASVYRWGQGKFSPRDSSKIRAVLNSPRFLSQLLRPPSTEDAAKNVGIHSMDFFFQLAPFAKNIFKFKSFLDFQLSDSEQVQHQMKHLLETNDQLKLYYVFPSGSRAEETFCRFFELLTTLNEEWTRRIQQCPISDGEGILALGLGYTGVVIIEYSDDGRKRFGRLIDILLEVPIRSYENDEPNPFVKKSVWNELRTEEAHNLWAHWKGFLERKGILETKQPLSVAS